MTTVNLLANLYCGILEFPGENDRRLVYADCLEEAGQGERAEFIRVQINMARMSERECGGYYCDVDLEDGSMTHRAGCRWLKLHRHEQELWLANRHLWGDLPGPAGDATNELSWWGRGFVERMTCNAADFLRYADALLWHPSQVCGRCRGEGTYRHQQPAASDKRSPCPVCSGTGKRPCPPTAQPITEVRLTDWSTSHLGTDSGFTSRWPWITFHLPEA